MEGTGLAVFAAASAPSVQSRVLGKAEMFTRPSTRAEAEMCSTRRLQTVLKLSFKPSNFS